MYIESVPNRDSPPAVLLRESYRENDKVRNARLRLHGRQAPDRPGRTSLGEADPLHSRPPVGAASAAHWLGQRGGRIGPTSGLRQRHGGPLSRTRHCRSTRPSKRSRRQSAIRLGAIYPAAKSAYRRASAVRISKRTGMPSRKRARRSSTVAERIRKAEQLPWPNAIRVNSLRALRLQPDACLLQGFPDPRRRCRHVQMLDARCMEQRIAHRTVGC